MPGFDGVEVVGHLAELDDVPAVPGEALRDVVGVRELRGAVDGDVVVVVDVDDPAEPEVTRERCRLVAHALFEATVAAGREHVVIDHTGAVPRPEVRLRERDADPVGESLPERAGGDLDSRGVPVLGVTGGARSPLPQRLDVVELEAEAGEEQHVVEQHRSVPVRQHEPVTIGPVRRARVVPHDARPEHVREWRQRHRRARVAVPGLLHRVHRKPAHHVDAALLDLRRSHDTPCRRCAGQD